MRKTFVTVFLFGILAINSSASNAWNTLETEHFLVHFSRGYQELARTIAQKAEEIHPLVTTRLGHTPKTKTHIVMDGSHDFVSGSAGNYTNNSIHITLIPPVLPYSSGISASRTSWLESLLIHEFTHIVHVDMNAGIYSIIRRIFGMVPVVTSPNIAQGLHLIEGRANYEEIIHTPGLAETRFRDMFLRTAALEGMLLHKDQTAGYYNLGQWNPGSAPYLYGFAYLDYIARTYGDEALRQLYLAAPYTGLFGGAEAGFQEILGISFAALEVNWREAMAKKYQKQAADIRAAGLSNFDYLPTEDWYPRQPTYSQQGILAYQTQGQKIPSIRLFDPSSKTEIQVLALGVYGGFAWLPDSKHIIYSAPAPQNDQTHNDLFIQAVASRVRQRLSVGLQAIAPAISPDGSKIAFIQLNSYSLSSNVCVAPLYKKDGNYLLGPIDVLLQGDTTNYAISLAWNPTGELLAVERAVGQGRTGIYLLNSSRNIIPIIEELAHVGQPAFSPDGRYLLFESDRTGVANLYAYNLETKQLRQLTNVLSGAFFPKLTPDGQFLIFTHYTAQGYCLAQMPFKPETSPQPMPPFVGSHWQVAPWRKDALIGTPGTVSAELSPRPYKVSSLKPSWWLPYIWTETGGLKFGIITGMQDALRKHYYILQTEYGLASGKPGLSLNYNWQHDPVFSRGLDFNLSLKSQEHFLKFEAGYTKETGPTQQEPNTRRIYGGIQLAKRNPNIFAGWQHQRLSGIDLQHSQKLNIQLSSSLNEDTGRLSLLSGWSAKCIWPSAGSLGIETVAAITQKNTGFCFGSATSPLHISGVAPNHGNVGEWAVKFALSAQRPLRSLYRGHSLLPIFFEQFVGEVFAQFGVGARHNSAIAALGAGVHLDTSLIYGRLNISPRLGASLVWSDEVRIPSVHLVGSLHY